MTPEQLKKEINLLLNLQQGNSWYARGWKDALISLKEELCSSDGRNTAPWLLDKTNDESLEEAIWHAAEVSARHGDNPCGQEHKKLLEWLKELKTRRIKEVKQKESSEEITDIASLFEGLSFIPKEAGDFYISTEQVRLAEETKAWDQGYLTPKYWEDYEPQVAYKTSLVRDDHIHNVSTATIPDKERDKTVKQKVVITAEPIEEQEDLRDTRPIRKNRPSPWVSKDSRYRQHSRKSNRCMRCGYEFQQEDPRWREDGLNLCSICILDYKKVKAR